MSRRRHNTRPVQKYQHIPYVLQLHNTITAYHEMLIKKAFSTQALADEAQRRIKSMSFIYDNWRGLLALPVLVDDGKTRAEFDFVGSVFDIKAESDQAYYRALFGRREAWTSLMDKLRGVRLVNIDPLQAEILRYTYQKVASEYFYHFGCSGWDDLGAVWDKYYSDKLYRYDAKTDSVILWLDK